MTKIWGEAHWKLFHLISTIYPNNPNSDDIKYAKMFLNSIGYILPCGVCAQHYKASLSNFKIKNGLNSQQNFIEWFIQFHNVVNKSIGNPILSYDDAIKKIQIYTQNNNNNTLLTLLNDVLFYTKHVVPEKGTVTKSQKKEIERFIKSILHFGNFNLDFNINYKNRIEFVNAIDLLMNNLK